MTSIAQFTDTERHEYETRLKSYRDLKNCIDDAEDRGVARGQEKEKKETIKRLQAAHTPIGTIALATGLTEEEIRLLTDM